MPARSSLGVIIVASLAGLLFGFDTAVISGVTQALREAFALTPAGLGLAVSAALWGTLLGALTLGRPGDRYGSRTVLIYIGVLYVIGAVGCAFSWALAPFLLCRFLIGIAIGGSSVLAPVYIAEAAPSERRGVLVGLFQINIVIGILLAYVSNFLVTIWIGGDLVWRWKLAMAVAPAALFLSLLLTIPHSPRWLIHRGRLTEAIESLRRLGYADPAAVSESIRSAELASTTARVERLSWQAHRRPILLAVGLGMFNQLSGINAILYYLSDIFGAAGFSSVSANVQSIVIGATNLLATIVAMGLIDRAGRRTLLLIGSIGCAAAQAGVATVMALGSGRGALLPLLVLFIASFALSQGAVIWVYLSEIFPTAVRARGQSLGSATHWIMNAIIAGIFPVVATWSKSLPFVFFSAMMLLQYVLVRLYLPETRGVALEQMQGAMQAPTPSVRG